MSCARSKDSRNRVLSAGFPSPRDPKWVALQEQVRMDQDLTIQERELTECLMDRFENSPGDVLFLRPILRRVFGLNDNPVLHGIDNHTTDSAIKNEDVAEQDTKNTGEGK